MRPRVEVHTAGRTATIRGGEAIDPSERFRLTLPVCKGLAHRIKPHQLERLVKTSGFKPVKVTCERYDTHSNWNRIGNPFEATALVAKEKYRQPGLMPSIKAFYILYRGALVSSLSADYLGHVTLLRPYVPAHGGKKAQIAQRIFVTCVLAPQFLVLYMPLVALQKLLGEQWYTTTERMKLAAADVIRFAAIVVERLVFRPIFGDIAYGIQQE